MPCATVTGPGCHRTQVVCDPERRRDLDRDTARHAELGPFWQEHDLVCPTSIGTPVEPRSFNRKWLGGWASSSLRMTCVTRW